MPLPEIPRLQLDLLLELIDAADVRVQWLDQRIRKMVARDAGADRLQTVPGIGPFGPLSSAPRVRLEASRTAVAWSSRPDRERDMPAVSVVAAVPRIACHSDMAVILTAPSVFRRG